MLKSKTHFEQVPLEAVRKIVEEQAAREITIKQESVTAKEKVGERSFGSSRPTGSKFAHIFSGEVIKIS